MAESSQHPSPSVSCVSGIASSDGSTAAAACSARDIPAIALVTSYLSAISKNSWYVCVHHPGCIYARRHCIFSSLILIDAYFKTIYCCVTTILDVTRLFLATSFITGTIPVWFSILYAVICKTISALSVFDTRPPQRWSEGLIDLQRESKS